MPAAEDAGTLATTPPTMNAPRRTIPTLPVMGLPGVEAAHKVQSRSTQGWFSRWRWACLLTTQRFFFALPWSVCWCFAPCCCLR